MRDFIDWRSPTSIKTEYGLTGRPTIYLHAHALGLFEKRQRNVRKALEHIIEQAGDVTVNAAAVVSAIQTYNKINAPGQWLDHFPFLLILPIKSKLAYIEVELLLHARWRKTQKDLATVGTPHFAQFVPLGNNEVGFFTVYDGSFDKYIADFTKYMGPVFDLVFKFTKDPPPSPSRKHCF